MTLVERLRALRHEVELRWSGAYAENMVNTVATAADRIEQLEAALREANERMEKVAQAAIDASKENWTDSYRLFAERMDALSPKAIVEGVK